jgi:hypothetical protein
LWLWDVWQRLRLWDRLLTVNRLIEPKIDAFQQFDREIMLAVL